MKNKFRCAGCDKLKPNSQQTLFAWHRVKLGPTTISYAFCTACAKQKKKNETGKAFCIRINPITTNAKIKQAMLEQFLFDSGYTKEEIHSFIYRQFAERSAFLPQKTSYKKSRSK